MPEPIYKVESYQLIGACFDVYKEQGCGYSESIYNESLTIELGLRDIPFISKPQVQLSYKGRTLEQFFEPDFITYGKITLEIKAIERLTDRERAQAMKYLKATGHQLGLLVNFGHFPGLEWERIVNTVGRIASRSASEPPDLLK
jgi:GxxExxY protein